MWKYKEPVIDDYDDEDEYEEALNAYDYAEYLYLERKEDARHCV